MAIANVIITVFFATVVAQFVIRTAVDLYLEIKEKLKHENTEH